jgi:hypothetical protein
MQSLRRAPDHRYPGSQVREARDVARFRKGRTKAVRDYAKSYDRGAAAVVDVARRRYESASDSALEMTLFDAPQRDPWAWRGLRKDGEIRVLKDVVPRIPGVSGRAIRSRSCTSAFLSTHEVTGSPLDDVGDVPGQIDPCSPGSRHSVRHCRARQRSQLMGRMS